jgi:hypothetical protein
VELSRLFDRVVCINLDRRPDRWEALTHNLASCGWPFAPVTRARGVDASKLALPSGWRHGVGAWGCLQSHRRVVEDALLDGVESLLVLEDDALFPPDFGDRAARFMDAVPQDWEGVMFGGQHLAPPAPVSNDVVRCALGHRAHCYSARGQYLRELYQTLVGGSGHADFVIQTLHKKHRVYAPARWIVAQGAGKSDINSGTHPVRHWNAPNPEAPVLVVAGLHGSGALVVAEACRRAGILFGPDPTTSPLLDRAFTALMDEACPFPATQAQADPKWTRRLEQWLRQAGGLAASLDALVGIAHPAAPLLWPALQERAGTRLRLVHVDGDRPGDGDLGRELAGVKGLERASVEALAARQSALRQAIGAAAKTGPTLTIDFQRFQAAPADELARILGHVGLAASPARIDEAAQYVLERGWATTAPLQLRSGAPPAEAKPGRPALPPKHAPTRAAIAPPRGLVPTPQAPAVPPASGRPRRTEAPVRPHMLVRRTLMGPR